MSSRNLNNRPGPDARYLSALKNFDAAVRYIQKENYEKAREALEKIVEGPVWEVTDRARVYLRVCEQKLGRSVTAPKTAQEFYDLGVAQLNARDLEAAITNLLKADRLDPKRGHIRYALAIVHGYQGNTDTALEHLKAAIELDAKNRTRARRDEDLQSLADDPRFKRLVYSEGVLPSGTTS